MRKGVHYKGVLMHLEEVMNITMNAHAIPVSVNQLANACNDLLITLFKSLF